MSVAWTLSFATPRTSFLSVSHYRTTDHFKPARVSYYQHIYKITMSVVPERVPVNRGSSDGIGTGALVVIIIAALGIFACIAVGLVAGLGLYADVAGPVGRGLATAAKHRRNCRRETFKIYFEWFKKCLSSQGIISLDNIERSS